MKNLHDSQHLRARHATENLLALALAKSLKGSYVMIFRQLFEPLSSTYTSLLGCEETGQALLIDPVIVSQERDLAEISRLGLKLAYTVDTHIHATTSPLRWN